MSSNDRRNEPIGGEPVPATAEPSRPVASTQRPAVNGGKPDERSIVRPAPRVRTAKPKRPVSQRLASLIPPPVTADDSGSIATVADATVSHEGASTNGPTEEATSTNGRAKGNGTARKRRPPSAAGGKVGQNRNGSDNVTAVNGDIAIFDPGLIKAATAPPDSSPKTSIEPVAEAVVESPVEPTIESDRVESDQAGFTDVTAQPSVIDVIASSPPAQTPDNDVTSRLDDHGSGDGIVSDISSRIDDAPTRTRRKPTVAGLIQRFKESLTVPSPVPVQPGTVEGRLGELPPPLAPPVLQPLPPAPLPDVIAPADRVHEVPAPTALQPQVPDFPSPTRLLPTTIGFDTTHRTRPNYVDIDDEPALLPTVKRPVRSTAPVRRRPRIRRVTRVIRHVDPWSVFKVAVCFSTVLYGVCLTAGVLLWNVAYTTGTIDNIERFFESFGWDRFEFKGGELYHSAWIAGLFATVGLTGLIVLGATLFNLITDLVGGIRVTVLEEEVVERDPATRRPALRGRRVDPKPVIDPYDPDAPLESMGAMPATVEPVWVEPARDLHR